MGIDEAGVSADGHGSPPRLTWRFQSVNNLADARLIVGNDGALVRVTMGSGLRSRRLGLRLPTDMWSAARPRVSWLQVILAGSVAILALEVLRPVAYQLPTLRATVETVMTLFALIAALLVRAQFAHTRRLRDLLLLGALLTVALTEFAGRALPAALHVRAGTILTAPLLLGHLLVAAALAASALTPPHRLIAKVHRPMAIMVALSVAAFAAAEAGGLLINLLAGAGHPAPALDPSLRGLIRWAAVLGSAGLFGYAAIGFARSGQVERHGGLTLLAGAAILMGAARLCYLAVPVVSPDAVSPAEGLRLLAFALVLAAALRGELALREGMARAATIAERRRVARDLHDGLAQDLAFIAAHGARMAAELGDDHPVVVAAKRALALSRGTISDLSDSSLTAPCDALEAIAHELRQRFEIAIAVDADPGAELASQTRDHVLRITREAIANAARHGGANNVTVSLQRAGSGLSLRVCDDGSGIGPGAATPTREGFGLRSIRERAAGMGGYMTIRDGRSGGTELEVVVP